AATPSRGPRPERPGRSAPGGERSPGSRPPRPPGSPCGRRPGGTPRSRTGPPAAPPPPVPYPRLLFVSLLFTRDSGGKGCTISEIFLVREKTQTGPLVRPCFLALYLISEITS